MDRLFFQHTGFFGVILYLLMATLSPVYAAENTLLLATTTSTDNTGLLDYLAPKFTSSTGIELKWTVI